MYGIMRTEKRKRQDVYGIQIEANRTLNDHLKGRLFPASNIDWSLTKDNYPLIPINNNWNKTISETLAKYDIKPRKNSVVLLDTIYTASAEFFEGKTKMQIVNYFSSCLEFHKKTYGDHVINAIIHFDEIGSNEDGLGTKNEDGTYRGKNYHLHIASIPLISSEDGTCRLSASDIVGNRNDLRKKQDDFYEQVSSLFGLDRGEIRDAGEVRKHLNKLDYEIQMMNIKSQKAKSELSIRERVLDACKEPIEQIEILSSTSENKLLNKPATSTIRTSDLERLEAQIKTSKDLQNGLKALDKLAKETIEIASTDEKIINMQSKLQKSQAKCTQLEKSLSDCKTEISRLTSCIQKWEQWFNICRKWIHKRCLLKDFEQFYEHETKELVREEIEYKQGFARG